MHHEPAMHIPIVLLIGKPFERGCMHGRRFRKEIQAAVTGLMSLQGRDRLDAARRRAEIAWPLVRDMAPSVACEIEGIAEGSGTPVPDIMLRSGFEFLDEPPIAGCSGVALTGSNGAIVAQNWDAPVSVQQELVLFLHVGQDEFELATVASYGGLCWVGCNRRGLALVNNDLLLTSAELGLPSQIIRRLMLEEHTVCGAITKLKGVPHMTGRSYLLGDASGEVAGIEVSASIGVRVNQRRSPVLHTNHALDADIMADENESVLMKTHPSSRRRYEVLRRKCPAAPTVAAVLSLLADKDGYPDAICKGISLEEPTATAFSAIFDCGNRTLFLCPGAPGERPYQTFVW